MKRPSHSPFALFVIFLLWLPEVQTALKVNKTPLVSHWEHMSGEKPREAWVLRVFCLLIQHCEMVRCSLMSHYIHHCLCCLAVSLNNIIFLIRSYALSCFFAALSGTEGFLYKHSTSINVFVIKHRPGHVISQTSRDGVVRMDVASHHLHPAV